MENSEFDKLNRKKSLLAILIKMAFADKEFAPLETMFIQKASTNMGLNETEVKAVVDNIDSFNLLLPKQEKDRIRYFLYALAMMTMDSKIDKKEHEFAKEVGFKLGLRNDLIIDLIDNHGRTLTDTTEQDEIDGILLRYLN